MFVTSIRMRAQLPHFSESGTNVIAPGEAGLDQRARPEEGQPTCSPVRRRMFVYTIRMRAQPPDLTNVPAPGEAGLGVEVRIFLPGSQMRSLQLEAAPEDEEQSVEVEKSGQDGEGQEQWWTHKPR